MCTAGTCSVSARPARARRCWCFGRQPEAPLGPAAAAPTRSGPAARRGPRRAPSPREAPEEPRARGIARSSRPSGTPGPDLRTAEHVVAGPRASPSVRVRVYYPPDAADGPVPACLTFFGGAFRIGGIDYPTTDAASGGGPRLGSGDGRGGLCSRARAPVSRRMWSRPMPHWCGCSTSAGELGIDADRIGVAGTSAGAASCAAALTLVNRDRTVVSRSACRCSRFPSSTSPAGISTCAPRAPSASRLHRPARAALGRAHLSAHSGRRPARPYASPLRASSLEGLPPAVILTPSTTRCAAMGPPTPRRCAVPEWRPALCSTSESRTTPRSSRGRCPPRSGGMPTS